MLTFEGNTTSIYGNYTNLFGNNTTNERNGNNDPFANLPYIAIIDYTFKPDIIVEICILCFFILFFIPTTILYIINKKNVYIKYRQPNTVIVGAILSGLVAILLPVN
ncbi:hypothetical protein BCR32DRAFT_248518 [Anaeromyces robustus]|uniref:Uncharacterized protein n=1 Tax=Anaeromyces robustus TaxID=1754192 RepID=A0A1Y1WTJ4_9FUNG|nr:hypothetical protein BCR32DRAFT_248518 [Anaeromyces robustus]|eukprot:ORX76715.1 hypothetical protein BCR32DRAFT_248518 [Anaeromyces robustus]